MQCPQRRPFTEVENAFAKEKLASIRHGEDELSYFTRCDLYNFAMVDFIATSKRRNMKKLGFPVPQRKVRKRKGMRTI